MYSTWASSTFDPLLSISTGKASHANVLRDEALRTSAWEASTGTDLVVLTFQLLLDCETVIFFLFCFLSFIFSFSVLSYFLDVFFASLLSLTHSPPSLPHPICSTQKGTAILFCSRPFVWLFRVLGLRKKYGLLCGLKQTRTQSLFMCFGGERGVGWGARGVSWEGTKEK